MPVQARSCRWEIFSEFDCFDELCILYYIILYCIVLYCIVLYCIVCTLYCVMLCCVMLCYVMLCYVMLCYVMLCYVMLCYVTKRMKIILHVLFQKVFIVIILEPLITPDNSDKCPISKTELFLDRCPLFSKFPLGLTPPPSSPSPHFHFHSQTLVLNSGKLASLLDSALVFFYSLFYNSSYINQFIIIIGVQCAKLAISQIENEV